MSDPAHAAPAATGSEPSQQALRVLAVHAHPDDESSKGAATVAHYIKQGARAMVVSCTGGERGGIQNPGLKDTAHAERDMAGARRLEMDRAAEILGIEHRWLGFIDSGLPEGDPLPPLPYGCFGSLPLEEAAAPLVRLVREFRPQVIIAYDEDGGYGHPDHIMAHKVAVEAFHKAGDPEAYPSTGEPWTPSKLYYDVVFNRERFVTLHEAVIASGQESPFQEWLGYWAKRKDKHPVTTKIDCAEYFPQRDAALKAHATQVDPEGFFFAIDLELQRRVWPWEEYSLIESTVETSLPETDLFAGITASEITAS